MRITGFVAVAAGVLIFVGAGSAADLTKVDRTIKREPTYQSKPRYCLLIFGPQAKHRVWLVLDGDTLYVDKNGNGDLTEAGEHIKAPSFNASSHPAHERERSIEVGDISVDGLVHAGLTVSQTQYRRKVDASGGTSANTPEEWQGYLDSIWRQIPGGLVYMVSINLDAKCSGLFGNTNGQRVLHFAWIDSHGQLAFADRPQDAPVIHFGGSLTLRVAPSDKLRRGANPGQTTLCLGTPGLGPGSFATMSYDLVPKNVCPVVEVCLPAKGPGRESLTRKYVLKERC